MTGKNYKNSQNKYNNLLYCSVQVLVKSIQRGTKKIKPRLSCKEQKPQYIKQPIFKNRPTTGNSDQLASENSAHQFIIPRAAVSPKFFEITGDGSWKLGEILFLFLLQ